jgi:hypothetical protein
VEIQATQKLQILPKQQEVYSKELLSQKFFFSFYRILKPNVRKVI